MATKRKKQQAEFTNRMTVLKQFVESSTNKYDAIYRLDTESPRPVLSVFSELCTYLQWQNNYKHRLKIQTFWKRHKQLVLEFFCDESSARIVNTTTLTNTGGQKDQLSSVVKIETSIYTNAIESNKQKGDVQQFVVLDYPNGITDPISLDLLEGFKPGFAITVVAQTCDVFKFEIKDCSGNILLHVITRFAENCIILNSYFCTWGPEERTKNMPIEKNEKFSLVCTNEADGYRVFIDGMQIAFYKHRSTNPPEECNIEGGAQIFKVIYAKGQPLWAIKNTTLDFGPHGIPSYITTLPQLVPGSWISMAGLVNADCVYIGIDLLNEHGDILFHFNPRFNQGQVVRNSFLKGRWGVEETEGGMPLTKGKQFCIAYVLETSCIRVYVNGIEFTTYNHRAIYAPKTTIRISTGIKLLKFSFVQ